MTGQTIAHYRILDKLGSGGMGEVYGAVDVRLGRTVAVKFLSERLASDKNAVDRFQLEARAASWLNHPNICTIYDIGQHDGAPYIVMEMLEGGSLRSRIQQGPMPSDQMLDVGIQIADALDAAHTKGIIHRDIKPGNIYVTERGQAKILDFGLAKLAAERRRMASQPVSATGEPLSDVSDDSLTNAGIIPGTTFYMSPEQARSEELDGRSDIFSLGVVLYEMATGKKPFAGKTAFLTLEAILNAKAVSPMTLNPKLPEGFEEIVGKALEKDREQRYRTAAELRHDLQRLKQESDSGTVRASGSHPSAVLKSPFRRASLKHTYLQLAIASLLVVTLVALTAWWAGHGKAVVSGPAPNNTIAILPFQNLTGDPANDYLRLALADEVSGVLTHTRSLEVRPMSATQKYTGKDVDLRKVGRDVHVANLLTGHYMRQGDKLLVTLEVVEVKDERALWQSNVTAAASDMIGLQSQLSSQIAQGLLPALGSSLGGLESATRPKNAEAYDLYLRSAAIPHDTGPNRQAIANLEKAVGLDPSYAPAWAALGIRYYYEASYAGGGKAMQDRSDAACERAIALDANMVNAGAQLAQNRVERGDLARAYQEAEDLVRRRPDSSEAHFTLSYVMRYAGFLDHSTQECDVALGLDPGYYRLRSCAEAFYELGRTDRAMDFVRLDASSEWGRAHLPAILLREGKIDEAEQAIKNVPDLDIWFKPVLSQCVQNGGVTAGQSIDARTQAALLGIRDPELLYYQGSLMAFCGNRDLAVRLIATAIQHNYCAYSALELDPLLASLRGTPEFRRLRDAATKCQQDFLVARTRKNP
ncbi:MAG TPA: protein kinase [Terriglobales bacterium]|nr:protein kinase [Terriglobales bacterium]